MSVYFKNKNINSEWIEEKNFSEYSSEIFQQVMTREGWSEYDIIISFSDVKNYLVVYDNQVLTTFESIEDLDEYYTDTTYDENEDYYFQNFDYSEYIERRKEDEEKVLKDFEKIKM